MTLTVKKLTICLNIVYLHKNLNILKSKLLVFALLFTLSLSASNQFLYRVHVGSYKKEEVPKNIREVPYLKKYVLPEGYNCFFSGGYYLYFEGAYRQLNAVKAKGFKDATIRVFKNERLVPVFDGLDHIEEELINPTPIPANQKLTKQVYSIAEKPTLKNRVDLYREIIMPYLTDTSQKVKREMEGIDLDWKLRLAKFGKFWGKKDKDGKEKEVKEEEVAEEEATDNFVFVEPKAKKKKKKEKKKKEGVKKAEEKEEELVAQPDSAIYDDALLAAVEEGMVEEEVEEAIEEDDGKIELNDKYIPDEKPEFRIYLTSAKDKRDAPMSIKYVPDIIYTFEKKKITLFTVGYYESSADAQADLAAYQSEGFYNAKIIGVYKSVVVSQAIADDLLARYLKAK